MMNEVKSTFGAVCLVAAMAGFGMTSGACGYGGKACQVVDIAKTACDVFPIRYMGPDGVERVEYVPVESIKQAAEHERLMRLSREQDAGAAK